MATEFNISLSFSTITFQNESKTIEWTVVDDNDPSNLSPSPVNITGWSVEFDVAESMRTEVHVIEKTTSSGITLTDPTAGVLQVDIDAADTIYLDAYDSSLPNDGTRYVYVLRRTDAGYESVLAYGTFTLAASTGR